MSTTQNKLGPRPAANLISFADHCFEAGATMIEYVIAKAAPSYPEVFTDKEEAAARARVLGRSYSERSTTRQVRVRWF